MDFLQDANFWLAISFVIFAAILWSKGKGALINLLDKRIDGIRKEIETAEQLRIEAQELLAQYQRKHRDAVKEAQLIIDNAQKHAAEISRKAEKELDEVMERREGQLRMRLERIKQNAIHEIQQYAADLAITATKEIITSKLDKNVNERLVSESIKDVGEQIH